jgi:transcriptional regulator with XRE-family HTH domain
MIATLEPKTTRKRLGLSQEQMAQLLGVSFVSVNRWEGGHSLPTGAIHDLYLAIGAALHAGHTPEAIVKASRGERGPFLYKLFEMAYSGSGRKTR